MSFFRDLRRDGAFYRRFFSLTGMIALQNIIVFSVNLADNLMLGAYKETALSGVALVNQIQFLLQMIVMGIGEGVIVLSSQYWGKRQTQPMKHIANIGMRLAAAASLLLFAVVFFFPQGVLGLLTNEPAVIDEGVKYLKIICFSYPLFAVTNTLLAVLRSVETVRIGFLVSFSTFCINVCLNSILIYGNLGAPELGSAGAAIATLISRTVEVVIILVYCLFRDQKLRLRVRDFTRRLEKSLLGDYIRVGMPVVASNAIWGIAMASQTAILGRLGESAIAANSIATTVFQILTVISYGASSATSVLVGKTIGESGMSRVKRFVKPLQVIYLLIGLITGAALFLVKDWILGFYSVSPQTYSLAIAFMTVLSVTSIGTSYQVAVLTGIVRGAGETKFILYNDSIFMWLIVIPSAALCAFVWNLSPVVVFCCLKCDQILKCAVAFVKVNFLPWGRQLTREEPLEQEERERVPLG